MLFSLLIPAQMTKMSIPKAEQK